MSSKVVRVLIVLAMVLTLTLGSAGLARGEQGGRIPASPFADEAIPGEGTTNAGAAELESLALAGSDIAGAGDWLVAQQKPLGCFPWTKGDTVCPSNTQGPSARGLLKAYELTGNATFLNAAVATGNYLVPSYPRTYTDGDPRFATHDPLFLEDLSRVSGVATYAAFMQTYFWDKLTAGTYGESNDMDASDFGTYVVTARGALAPWDLSATAVAAHLAGEITIRDDLMAAILAGLNGTTIPTDYDVGGLTGAVWASAVTGVDLDPTAGSYASANSTADLAVILASWQRSSDGAWLWGTGADPSDVTNGDTQNTAFAIMGLSALNPTTYSAEIARGAAFIRSVQATDGQILIYPTALATAQGGVETHSESMQALVTAAPFPPSVWIKYAGNPVKTGSMAMDPYVLKEGGTYKMWYTHRNDADTIWTIHYATSADGITWTGDTEVLAASGSGYDATKVGGPTVINDGGTYKMWFSARDAAAKWTIGYATSSDGLTWAKVGKVLDTGLVGSWDSAMVREPSVIKDGGTYKMWYAGAAAWPAFKMGYATSSDGTTWTKHLTNPVFSGTSGGWDGFQVYAPSVVKDGSTYHMFFSGTDENSSGVWSTGSATSSDGIAWTEEERNPILIPDTLDSLDYASGLNDGGIWKLWYSYVSPTTSAYVIGLATLDSSTQLYLDPAVGSIQNDHTMTKSYTVRIANAVDLYGYQFVITFDKNNLECTAAAFIDTFLTNPLAAPSSWNAFRDNTNGKVYFARTRQNPDLGINGSGPLATLTFRSTSGASAGNYKLGFTQNKLGDIDGNSLTHTTQYAWLTLYGVGTLSGSVDLQGRADEHGGTVTVMSAYGYLESQTITALDGSWSFTGVPAGAYQVNIEMARYLDAQKGDMSSTVAVSAGGTTTLAKVKLLGGDANDDDMVDISDATIIGGDFGKTTGFDPRADINNDGMVDILDLVLMGGNYAKVSPVPWS
jgi:hypothetical protein